MLTLELRIPHYLSDRCHYASQEAACMDDHPTGEICGMFNLDSTTAGAFQVLTTHPEIRALLEEKRELLCKLNI